MATAGDSRAAYKQDMVVSTRYRNDLPPPPMLPKLLNIETGGIDQYLTTTFASSLLKKEEPNIEVDAEGGMPIDMIGIPGYFLGDESAILAPENPAPLDPADLALMATPDQLRNANSKSNHVSFLRRTQYITSSQAARAELGARSSGLRPKSSKAMNQQKEPPIAKNDPVNIKRHIQKGFDIAYPESKQPDSAGPESSSRGPPPSSAEIEAWKNPVHPDNPKLTPVDYYPVLPDIEGGTDSGSYITVKFDKPPLPAAGGRRDERIDVSLLTAISNEEVVREHQAKVELYQQHPDLYADPGPEPYELDFMIPRTQSLVPVIKSKLDATNPSKDDTAGYDTDADGNPTFTFDRQRVYTPSRMGIADDKWRSVALSLVDGGSRSSSSSSGPQKAAYFYPIGQRMTLKPERRDAASQGGDVGTEHVDKVHLFVREPNEEEMYKRAGYRAEMDAAYREEVFAKMEDPFAGEKEEEEEDEDGDVREGVEERTVEANGRDADVDADGDADADGEPDLDAMDES
ncbi:MAG: hypothetical protein Q9227_008758 [Pyrenula ochraceoflavens]